MACLPLFHKRLPDVMKQAIEQAPEPQVVDKFIDMLKAHFQVETPNCTRKKMVLRYLVWVITINLWGLCPQTPGVYRLNTNPEEVKRGQQ
jgi:hypothetical protein